MARHGETEANRNLILEGGKSNGTLTEKGRKQTMDLAMVLRGRHFDAIYSSDLKRASDTATEIFRYHTNTPFLITSRLREIDVGGSEGKSFGTVEELFAEAMNPGRTGETVERFQGRLAAFLQSVYEIHRDGDVLFVCHGGVVMAYQNIAQGKEASGIIDQKRPDNATPITMDIRLPIAMTGE